jgi:hypothetical protein
LQLHEIVAKLRNTIRLEIPTGYQDEIGFHMGVKPAEKEVKWPLVCQTGSDAGRHGKARRKISATAKARISAAAKMRWAKAKGKSRL